jgi:hypothetical protein
MEDDNTFIENDKNTYSHYRIISAELYTPPQKEILNLCTELSPS